MPRALLVVFLLGAQLVSWNASPLFLCLDHDGAVCVDLGPDSCACCRHHHRDADATRNAIDHRGEPASIGAPTCDCTHVQITVAWTAVTVSRHESRSVLFPTASALLPPSAWTGVDSAVAAARLLISPPGEFASGIGGRSAILRC